MNTADISLQATTQVALTCGRLFAMWPLKSFQTCPVGLGSKVDRTLIPQEDDVASYPAQNTRRKSATSTVLPLRDFDIQLALDILTYHQQRKHVAFLSHRKRPIALVTQRE